MKQKQNGKQIGVKVPAELSRRIEAIAERERNAMSAVVRRLVALGLAEEDRRDRELFGDQ